MFEKENLDIEPRDTSKFDKPKVGNMDIFVVHRRTLCSLTKIMERF